MNKKQRNIGIIIFLLLVAFILVNQGVINLKPGVVAPVGCTPLGSETFTNQEVMATDFTCNYDKCIVKGSIEVIKGLGEDSVQCTTCDISKEYDSLDQCRDDPYSIQGGGSARCISGDTCTKQNCQEISTTKYSASFNFCPAVDPNFESCVGVDNNVISTDPYQTYYTEEKLLNKGDTLRFTPTNEDGSPVTTKSIISYNYDCSCEPAISSGEACASNQIYCQPILNQCPTGQTYFQSTIYCSDLGGQRSNICASGRAGFVAGIPNYQTCSNPIDNYGNYLKCDGTQTIGQSTCGDFSSTGTAPSGQQCFLKSNNQLGEGLGYLACNANACDGNSVGYKRQVTETSYESCVSISGCSQWSGTTTSCRAGLIFDEDKQACVCDEDNECTSPQDSQCVGESILDCAYSLTDDLGKKCYYYESQAVSCSGELECWDRGNSIADDVCSCEEVNDCEIGEIVCTSSTTYNQCSKDPNNPLTSCYSFRDLGGTVDTLEECVGTEIRERDDLGCSFNTLGFECSTKKDTNEIKIDNCVSNTCTIIDDVYVSSQTQLQQTKCIGNTVYKTNKYILDDRGANIGSVDVYRWEKKKDAVNTNDGLCDSDFICVELLSGQAQCSLKAEFVGILTKSNYGINEQINGIFVSLTDSVPNRGNLRILARLMDGTTELSRVDTFTDSIGQVSLNFNYGHPRSGTLTINVIAGDPAGVNYQDTKEIDVSSTLDVRLNCPVQGFVGKQVSCTWKTYNIDTNTLIDITDLEISVMQGGIDIPYSPVGRTGLTFTSSTSGGVLVDVKVNKIGFISDSANTLVSIEPLQQAQVFELDNKDFFSYSGSGISTGTHQLVMKVVDSVGQAEKVQNIQANVRTPSGQVVPISFNKVSDGNYKTTYNFVQAGTTYELSGLVIFEDITKESIPFSYSIATIQSQTPTQKINTLLLISIIGGVVILIIILLVVFLRKKK